MSVPADLRDQLDRARTLGATFSVAWPLALSGALAEVEDGEQRHEWALDATRETWRRCFDGEPPSPADRTLAGLLDDERCIAIPDRPCLRCGEPVSPERGPLAKFCCNECKRTWHGRGRRHPVAA
jgi:hypothetical protein